MNTTKDIVGAFLKVTQQMEETLMDCHEREILGLEPYDAASTRFVKGLILRGLLEVREHYLESGKKIFAVFVTHLGRRYLNDIGEMSKNTKDNH